MRIAFDATAAAVQHAGVGRYARELLRSLVSQREDDAYLLLCAAEKIDCSQLLDQLPPGAVRDLRRLPVSARISTIAWHRLRLPLRAERLVGDFDVFHGPDFVVPPSSKPRIVTIHDLSFVRFPELGDPRLVAYLQAVVPRAIRASQRVIAVSSTVAAEIADVFPDARHKIVAIPNGVRVQASEQMSDDTPSDPPNVLIVGTIEPRKNHLALLDAMHVVRERYPDATLTVAGRIGWRADAIVTRLRAAEARGGVRIVNAPTDEVLHALYRGATVFAYPSIYEGFGLPVLEAMSRRVPVVAGDIPALRESAGNAARFADVNSPEAIATEILALIEDTGLRAATIISGLDQASRFSWDEAARSTRRVYLQAQG